MGARGGRHQGGFFLGLSGTPLRRRPRACCRFAHDVTGLPACPCLPLPADPSMHAISYACTSPNDKWWVGQSMDNQSERAAGPRSGERGRG